MTRIHTTKRTKPILTMNSLSTYHDSAKDEFGNQYTYWEIDRLAMEEEAECTICEKTIDAGWCCLDGFEVFCDDCIIDIEQAAQYIKALEAKTRKLKREKAALMRTVNDFVEKYQQIDV